MKAGAQERQLNLCTSVLESNGTVASNTRQSGERGFHVAGWLQCSMFKLIHLIAAQNKQVTWNC